MRPTLAELRTECTGKSIRKAFYSMVSANRKSGRKEKFIQRRAMNDRAMRVLVMRIGVMIVCSRPFR